MMMRSRRISSQTVQEQVRRETRRVVGRKEEMESSTGIHR